MKPNSVEEQAREALRKYMFDTEGYEAWYYNDFCSYNHEMADRLNAQYIDAWANAPEGLAHDKPEDFFDFLYPSPSTKGDIIHSWARDILRHIHIAIMQRYTRDEVCTLIKLLVRNRLTDEPVKISFGDYTFGLYDIMHSWEAAHPLEEPLKCSTSGIYSNDWGI